MEMEIWRIIYLLTGKRAASRWIEPIECWLSRDRRFMRALINQFRKRKLTFCKCFNSSNLERTLNLAKHKVQEATVISKRISRMVHFIWIYLEINLLIRLQRANIRNSIQSWRIEAVNRPWRERTQQLYILFWKQIHSGLCRRENAPDLWVCH